MDDATLGDVLSQARDGVRLEDESEYRTVGILSYGRGLFERPVVKGGDVSYSTYFRIHANQFIYSKLFAWEGALSVVQPEHHGLFVSQEFPTFDVDTDLALPDYLRILTTWPALWDRVRLGESGMGGRRKRVHPDRLLSVVIPLPKLEDQRRIVDLVDAIDSQTKRAETALALAVTLRGALADHLVQGVSAPLRKLKELAVERGLIGGPFGSSLGSKDYLEIGVPIIRGANLSNGRFVGGEFAYVSSEKSAELARNTAVPGDLIATQRGTLGQVALVPDEPFATYIISQSQMRLRPDPTLATTEYLYVALSTSRLRREIERRKIATANPHINLGIFGDLEVPVPSLEEQQEIVENVLTVEAVVEGLESHVRATSQAREAIVTDLLARGSAIPDSYDELLEIAS